MKAVLLASLICVTTVAYGMELPVGYADGIESMQRTLQEAIDTPMSRNFKPNAASCPYTCTEPEFFLPAVQALSSCTAAQTALRVGIATSNSTASIDATWTTFCASPCFTAAQSIPAKFYCCLGDLGGAFFGLNRGCAKNANTNRFCGAELLNIGGVQCLGTTEGNCAGSGTSCEWDAAGGRCAFKPVATALDGICSPCIREYIETFPSGGIDSAANRNSIVAAYTAYCTKIQGDYCVITGGYDYQFRKADRLSNAELTGLCGESDASVKKRLCYKQVQGSIAGALRGGIQSTYAGCLAMNGTNATYCTTAAGASAGLSFALDRLTSMMCTNKTESSYCFALETQAPLASSCAATLIANNTCSSACATELTASASSLGCCLGAYAVSGSVATAGLAAIPRALSDSRALLFSGVLNRTASTPFISEAVLSQITSPATLSATLMAYSPLGRLSATCSITPTNDTSIAAVKSECYNPVPARPLKITIALNVSFSALTNANVINFAKQHVVADITNRLGITSASIVNVSFVTSARTISAAGQTGAAAADIIILLNIGSPAEAAMLKLEVAAQIAAGSLSLPLLATELAVNCPTCLSNTYSPIVASATLSVGTETTNSPSPTNGATSHTLMVAGSALVAILFAMM